VRLTQEKKLRVKNWEVYINGGRTATGLDAVGLGKKSGKTRSGEILWTSMDFDGQKTVLISN
jgi:cyclase